MNVLEHHEMELVQVYASGAEEWVCPVCERRFMVEWQPYKKIVLEHGNRFVIHSGGQGDWLQYKLQPPPAKREEADLQIMSDELRDALNDALDEIDLGES